MTNDRKMEALSTALTSFLRAEAMTNSCDVSSVNAEIRAENILLDAALDCGAPHHVADFKAWSARKVASWLVSA